MPAVADLLVYALLFFALALAIVAKSVTKSALETLAGWVGSIPLLGDALKNAVDAVAQAIDHALGLVVQKIEAAAGKTWHLQARLFDWALRELRAHAQALLQIATPVGAIMAAYRGLRALVHALEHAGGAVSGAVKTLEREYHGIEHRVKVLEREVGRGIGADVLPRIRTLEREYKAIDNAVTDALPKAIGAAEGELTQLENFIRAIPGTKYLDWAAGIVAAALGLGVFSLFKCPTFLNKTLGRGCGLWNGLEDLFGLFIDLLFFVNICELLPPLEALVSDVADPLVVGLTDIGAGLCSGGIGAPPTLAVPTLSLPANPSLALNLP